MTNTLAGKIYDILIKTCDANEHMRGNFIQVQTEDDTCHEYRFSGALGYGGKFRIDRHANSPFAENLRLIDEIEGIETKCPWYVDCYQEHLTPERKRMIKKANQALTKLWKDDQRLHRERRAIYFRTTHS